MADPNTPTPPARQPAQASSQGGMMVPTPPLPEQASSGDSVNESVLSDATKAEREAGKKAMKENVSRTQAEQEAGKKAMKQHGGGVQGARPRPQQPPTQANQPQGRPNPLHGTAPKA